MWTTLSTIINRPPARTRRAPRRSVPRLQRLDDRLVPATFTVTQPLDLVEPDNTLSLREAITRANANPGPDVIKLPAGTLQISLFGAEDGNVGGDFDIRDSVALVGVGAGRTIISGTVADRVFQVFGTSPSSIQVKFQNLTIRGGFAQFGAPGDFPNGGAVDAGNADVKFQDCILTGNAAGWRGGAVAGTGGALTLTRTTVARNHADNGGGIFWELGPVQLTGSAVRFNQAESAGGGLYADVVNGTNSTITGNRADAGGGIFATIVNLDGSTVSGNRADFFGGGIAGTTTNLTNSTVSANVSGGSGGGIDAAAATLTGSTVRGNLAAGVGGGMNAGTADLTRSTVAGNSAEKGGGIFANEARLAGSTVRRNRARDFGGGIAAPATDLTDSSVIGNTAGGLGAGIDAATANLVRSTVRGNAAGGGGGGIHGGTANLTDSTVSDNTANQGAGIFADAVNGTGSTVSDNTARAFGGGIAAPAVTLTGSTVSGNAAGQSGGGINAATVNLTNVTVSGNTTDGEGGGVFAAHGAIVNCTIVENVALFEGGGLSWAGESDPIHVQNTIIALNVALAAPDVDGTFVSIGTNLIGVADGSGTSFGVAGDLVGSQADPLDPKLGALASNGGRTQTHTLLAGSAAVDHGSNTGGPTTDQRGLARPRDGDGNGTRVVDIGAFER